MNSIVLLLAVIFVIFLVLMMSRSKDSFSMENIEHKASSLFNNGDYQYKPPSPITQNDYYKCLHNECSGNTYDYNCVEKCHLKAFRKDMENKPTAAWDAQTWVCMSYSNDKESFYKCLDQVYADYKTN